MTSVAVAVALAASTSVAFASSITVDGITWDPNAFFDFTAQNDIYTTSVTAPGDEVLGIGRVSSINSIKTFTSGELTFTIEDYIVSTITVNDAGTPLDDTDDFQSGLFTGGKVTFYSDATANFDALDATTAMDGNVWLELTAMDGNGDGYTLDAILATLASGANTIGLGKEGWFEVTGGSAMANFDTNSFSNGADLSFTASWQRNPGNGITPDGLANFGTVDLKGNSIPEPAPLGIMLLGLGLLAATKVKKVLKLK